MKKMFLLIGLYSIFWNSNISATDNMGKQNFKKCQACHGAKAEKKALGASQVINGWEIEKIINALKGYKDGSYGGAMKGVMEGQVVSLSDTDITMVAQYIHSLSPSATIENKLVLGKQVFTKCQACHGTKAEKKALGASQIISGWEIENIVTALQGYKYGSYGGAMKGVMKGQVVSLSDADITTVAQYINSLPSINILDEEPVSGTQLKKIDINIPIKKEGFLKRNWGKIAIGTAVVITGAAIIAEKYYGIPIKDTAIKIGNNIKDKAVNNMDKIASNGSNLIQKITPTLAKLSAKKINFNKDSLVKNIPNKIGIYMVKLKGSKTVNYVGRAIENRDGQSTSGLRKRLFEHLRSGKFGEGATVMFKECGTVEACKQLEAVLIKGFNPSMNKRFESIK